MYKELGYAFIVYRADLHQSQQRKKMTKIAKSNDDQSHAFSDQADMLQTSGIIPGNLSLF